eukprot:TRINITY_DN41276_c0_g1_i1.p1 TRINITY_DN41276_c0_g1~~TRINITY_DN41276_c0_g1_i1.p1  ORF type:complete len:390 (-),score=70.59 TRINITY_DN41276_c0_g1_i1:313-1482(-)
MAAVAALPPPTAQDVRQLRSQVEQMKERLDFVSSMLPLVNFSQDYFQKVECEASVQLMRLQSAQVARAKGTEEDDVSSSQLETVKFLHFLTDAVLALHIGSASPTGAESASASPLAAAAVARPLVTSRLDASLGTAARKSLSGSSTSTAAASADGTMTGSPADLITSRLSDSHLPAKAPVGGTFLLGGRGPTAAPSAASTATGASTTVPSAASATGAGSLATGLGAATGLGVGLVGVPPGAGGAPGNPAPLGTSRPVLQGYAEDGAHVAEPLAEPGTGGTAGALTDLGSLDGLVLGLGSWATAYRQANGARRDALKLLCTSGIVTVRELADDLTVISEEHIEECVLIAGEMLATWPMDMWARQPEEAKKFFEARLTALYQRKFGEQKAS